MEEQIAKLVDKYLGMMPSDVGCKNWFIMRLNLIEEIKQLQLYNVSGSCLPKCTRVEVIDKSGRAYTNYDCKSVETQMQDEERTLKVFIS